jgi:L-2-hydroxyglutarate oxidase LhgO
MRTQLLCTFTNKNECEDIIKNIQNSYKISFGKIYVLQNENDVNELICTYNVDLQENVDYNKVKGTISLHRKKHTNTLYTINALNELIKNLNNGALDKDFTVPWENFRNMILVTNSEGLNRISTRIYKIINIDE